MRFPRSTSHVLRGHANEVTGVDWCRTDVGRLVTLSDDDAVWIWRIDRRREHSAGDGAVGHASRTTLAAGQSFTAVLSLSEVPYGARDW